MSPMKKLTTGLVMTAILGLGSYARATVTIMIAGSPELWQSLALGTYDYGNCVLASKCAGHYTATFNLTDSRPKVVGGTPVVDTGAIWIVWDNDGNVWADIKVDSITGIRCYFANPSCQAGIAAFPNPATLISAALWGPDTVPPAAVQAPFTNGAGVSVNVAATDIRPEDAAFAQCRVNSAQGAGKTEPSPDNLDGLGYGPANPAGACAAAGGQLVGNAIQTGYPASTSTTNVVAFNITGTDPFTKNDIPAFESFTVGAAPIVFVFSRNGGQLAGLTNATDSQLQQVFSGALCDAAAFGLPMSGIAAYLRDPLSGPMNVAEATVFRRPIQYTPPAVLGVSQETGVNGANPLTGNSVPCMSSTQNGGRWRAIGNVEEIKSVLNSVTNNSIDGIGYTFFTYGNVWSIANSANYGYITLNGIDPIFHLYGTTYDPGQPAIAGVSGVLPAAANTPCAGGFPCAEYQIWQGGLSYPNLRNGSYRAWSYLRLISTQKLMADGGFFAGGVLSVADSAVALLVPDFVPYGPVYVGRKNKPSFRDPGLQLLRSHYQQLSPGSGQAIGAAPANMVDTGGDMGGCILSVYDLATQLIQTAPGSACVQR